MRRLWVVAALVLITLTAGAWSADRVDAQSPPQQQQKCVSIHEVHPSLKPDGLESTAIPAGYRVYPLADVPGERVLIREVPLIRSGEVVDARPGLDQQTQQPIVTLRFDTAGTRKFGQFTSANVKQSLAIVVGGQVISAPVIQTPVLGGTVQISGSFALEDARQFAERIRSGMCR